MRLAKFFLYWAAWGGAFWVLIFALFGFFYKQPAHQDLARALAGVALVVMLVVFCAGAVSLFLALVALVWRWAAPKQSKLEPQITMPYPEPTGIEKMVDDVYRRRIYKA